jgi:hypothetical protein
MRAPGTFLDVCVVLDQCDRHIDHLIDQIAWEVGFEHELIIIPICFSSEEFEHGPMSESTLMTIDAVPKQHPFDMKYHQITKVPWESCAKVLDATNRRQCLARGWGTMA